VEVGGFFKESWENLSSIRSVSKGRGVLTEMGRTWEGNCCLEKKERNKGGSAQKLKKRRGHGGQKRSADQRVTLGSKKNARLGSSEIVPEIGGYGGGGGGHGDCCYKERVKVRILVQRPAHCLGGGWGGGVRIKENSAKPLSGVNPIQKRKTLGTTREKCSGRLIP